MFMKVVVYIDGFNLYFGINESYGKKYLWLDLECLANSLLLPGETLSGVKYFTSLISNNPAKEQRQQTFIQALQTATSCQFYYGRYQAGTTTCRNCRINWPSPKEKMTDVNIACELLKDAFTDKFDKAIVVSGDADLVPPINIIKQYLPSKRIGFYFPPNRHSIHLSTIAHFSAVIGKKKLRSCQLPDSILKPDGFVLQRPATWV
jgi:uncharacterized LabA/DUF88 family protein